MGWLGLMLLVAGFGQAARAERTIQLAWDASASPDVAGYFVYSLEENALVPTRLDAGAGTHVTVTGLKEGLRYDFTVTAYNASGLESLPSNRATFTVPVPLKILPPAAGSRLMRLQFPVAPAHWYELQVSTDLNTWNTVWQTGLATSYSWTEFQDPQSAGAGSRFYRLQIH